jgi:DegV family protein with EDD domain
MVKIITDSTANFPTGVIEKHDITVVPLYINFEKESYRDGIDIDNETFLNKLKSVDSPPTTSAPSPKLFADVFKRLAAHGESLLCVLVSGQMSGTFNAAVLAAESLPHLDIRVIDSKMCSGPLGTLVTKAAEWSDEGLNVDKIKERVNQMIERGRIYFMVDDLKFLAKSGRVSAPKALFGSLVQLKPILTFKEGSIVEYVRTRTQQKATERMIQVVKELYPSDGSGLLSVMHANALETAHQFAEDLKRRFDLKETPPVFNLSTVIVLHAGPGIFGPGFFVSE